MWGQVNRTVVVLVSVLSGCIILYNIWGSFIWLTIFFLVVIYTCISLLVTNDLSTFTFTLQILNRAGELIHNLARYIYYQASVIINNSLEFIKTFYQERIVERMSSHRRNTYQLSSESLINSNLTSELGFIGESSPISKNKRLVDSRSENINLSTSKNSRTLKNTRSFDKINLSDRNSRNGDVNSSQLSWKKRSSSYLGDNSFLRGESTIFSPEGSPWGTSISPKVNIRNQEVNTVQTVAGPLLSSTRFNIDPKMYSDVTSPGLTSRLSKYANEANNKLTHQSQYSIGQFPKVNLNCNPTPLLNAKVGRIRSPVTVRVAPPETIKYSPPEKQKILSDICRSGNNKSPSVVQVLKEISLKRHASRDDMCLDLIKKQKTDGIYSEKFENYDEGTQKRTREDSSRSDEEISIENTTRPIKRTKTPCYDVLNSIASNTNTVSSGVKRKADISRSGTPELGKHFKSVDSNRSKSSPILPQPSGNLVLTTKEIKENHLEENVDGKRREEKNFSPEGLSKSLSPTEIKLYADKNRVIIENEPIKYTDRLFMKAEPQNIDKLKSLIEEHKNVALKFSGDDGDEIKKSDVIIMRQTSMKARLRSMFDAISGKSSSQIDPSIVIQAESITPRSSLSNELASISPSIVTLNSSTSTTNVNTSPISTSAVVPIIGNIKDSSTPAKHVTFQLSTESNSKMSSITSTTVNISTPIPATGVQMQKPEEVKKTDVVTSTSNLMSFLTPVSNKTSLPTFSFGTNSTTKTSTPLTIPSTTTENNSSVVTSTNNFRDLSAAISAPSIFSTSQVPTTASVSNTMPKSSSFMTNVSLPSKSEPTSFGFELSNLKPVTASQTPGILSFGSTVTNPTSINTQNSFTTSSSSPATSQFQFSSTSSAPVAQIISSSNISATNDKPGLFMGNFGGSNTSVSAVSSIPTFAFGTSNTPASTQSSKPSAPQSGFSFGPSNTLPEQKSNLAQNTPQVAEIKPMTASTSMFSFGSNTNTSAPFFESTTSSTTVSTVNSTTPSVTSSSTSAPKPLFSFGMSNTSSSAPLTFGTLTQSSSTWFGSTTSQASQPTTSFITAPSSGVTSTSTSSSSTTPIFGTNNSQSSIFLPASNTLSSNTSAIQFGVPKTAETPTFSTNPTTASSIFNGINPAVTSSTSIFSGKSSIFGQSKAPTFTAKVTSSFGSNTAPSFGTSTTAFGPPSTSSSFVALTPAATTTQTFGTPNVTTPCFGTPSLTSSATPLPSFRTINSTVSNFGSPNNTKTTFNTPNTATPSFGTSLSSNPTNSLFGTSQNTNSTTSTFNTTTPSFGVPTTTPPVFAPTTTSAPSFGASSSSGFGGSNTASSMFGSGNSGFSGFGSSSANTTSPFATNTSSAPAFGASTAIPAFGASTSNNTGTSTFAFENTTNQPQAQPQQSSVFSFGPPGSTSNSSGGVAPFQFGASSSQPGGFNFTGGSSLSGSFNASNQGSMFSIGSGSATPKSRSQRSRRHQR